MNLTNKTWAKEARQKSACCILYTVQKQVKLLFCILSIQVKLQVRIVVTFCAINNWKQIRVLKILFLGLGAGSIGMFTLQKFNYMYTSCIFFCVWYIFFKKLEKMNESLKVKKGRCVMCVWCAQPELTFWESQKKKLSCKKLGFSNRNNLSQLLVEWHARCLLQQAPGQSPHKDRSGDETLWDFGHLT